MRHSKKWLFAGACVLALTACQGKAEGAGTKTENTPTPELTAQAQADKNAADQAEPTNTTEKETAPTDAPRETPTPEPTPMPTKAPTPEPTQATEDTSKSEEDTMGENVVTVVECPQEVSAKRAGVEYGTVEHITYYSNTTGCERGANVLLPAGYTTDKKYSVMYFQHGIFGDEYSMINDPNNHFKEILGNLAADGMAREMIVVFCNMYATGNPELKPGFNAEQIAPYDNFINDLVNDLKPYIEANYSVKTGRENTAVLGFSMGGRESLFIGMSRSDLFAYTGAISPAPGLTPGKDWAMVHAGQWTEDELVVKQTDYLPELLMVCCGTKDSVVGTFPKSYHEIMERNAVDHIWYEVPGADHDNKAIQSGLYNFVIRWGLAEE